MTTFDETTMDRHIRDVADDEVGFYREHGWVAVPGLITRVLAEELLRHAQALMGAIPVPDTGTQHTQR